jgi:hypothetical protein
MRAKLPWQVGNSMPKACKIAGNEKNLPLKRNLFPRPIVARFQYVEHESHRRGRAPALLSLWMKEAYMHSAFSSQSLTRQKNMAVLAQP